MPVEKNKDKSECNGLTSPGVSGAGAHVYLFRMGFPRLIICFFFRTPPCTIDTSHLHVTFFHLDPRLSLDTRGCICFPWVRPARHLALLHLEYHLAVFLFLICLVVPWLYRRYPLFLLTCVFPRSCVHLSRFHVLLDFWFPWMRTGITLGEQCLSYLQSGGWVLLVLVSTDDNYL